MHNSNTGVTWEELKIQVEKTSKQCIAVANALCIQADKIKRRKRFTRGINIVIGGLAFIVSVIIPKAFHDAFVTTLSALASIALFVDGLIPSIVESNSPDRLQDYAYYVRNYSVKFDTALLDDTTDQLRKAKILVLLELAHTNLNNVSTMWPWVAVALAKSSNS